MANSLYFVETEGHLNGRNARWFLELDRDTNSAGAIRCLIRHDPKVIKVLEVIEPCEDLPFGRCLDVTDQLRREAFAHLFPENDIKADRQAWQEDHRIDSRKHERV